MKTNSKPVLIILLFFSFVLFWQCSWQGDSVGTNDKIYVFADSLDWVFYEDALNSVFGNIIRTPVAEREFLLEWVPFRYFDKYQNYKNIFIIGRLDSEMPVSQNVRELLNQEILEGVESGKYFYIPKKDVWALHQYLLFMVANSRDDMIQRIHDLGDLMYEDFRKYYFQRLKEEMFAHMEQEKLEDYLTERYPFKIRVQHDYFVADESVEQKYVWLRRLYPDRSLLIHWVEVPEDFQLTSRWVIDQRNKIAKKLYKGDVVVEEETKAFQVEFKGRTAIRLEGTWRNDELVIGGPFIDICFVDRENGRIFLLDGYVQAIGQRKKPFIDQLDVLIHTFEVQKEPAGQLAGIN